MTLSTRAQATGDKAKGALIWEIIPNLWDPKSNPDGYVSLGVAENSLMHDEISKHIHDYFALSRAAFTYGDGMTGSKRLKKAIAHFLNRHLKPIRPLEPAHVDVTNGCSSAIEHLSWALANPGECFLLGQPYYGTFAPDLTLRFGAKLLPVPFEEIDPLCEDAIGSYEKVLLDAHAQGLKVSGLIISHPHNPLGRCYPQEVLIGLMKLCEKYGVHFISDEIYALSVWDNAVDSPAPTPFESALTIDSTDIIDPSRVHVIWGMSKDFGANGLRIGVIISQSNPALHAAMIAVGLYSSPSSLSEHATVNLLEDDAWTDAYIKTNQKRLSDKYTSVVQWAKKNHIPYAPRVNAAFFLWLDLGKFYLYHHILPDGRDVGDVVAQRLLAKKVFLASGKDFGSEKKGWFRIVFSQDETNLNEGLDRTVAALR
ncbi:pyridoxal phosphate-dependent transferase [Ilyonectria robusta]|uniref:pyridoxal phosphate-dependent transferase n=1 Tax=Ilyonectria robusta TaxID=1079257 RepID=UPI001E8DB20D|nr:pyridoxal phosphate-dependent transferase [Ilyonectria robusta]KAH8654923.1 pyridoxal phosphate-dependent transferase [Ilyonectria robusta]